MNAVDILHNVEKYFDRNHNLFCMWGGLFALIFLGIFVPLNMVSRINSDMSAKLNAYAEQNSMLTAQVHDMSNQMTFFRLTYEQKQKVMRDVDCLAKNIYFEAGSEPRAGKIAVAEVTMNRVKSRQFPRTVCGVVYQKTRGTCQFSWVCENNKVIRSRIAWRESLQIAENILISNRKYGIIGSAKYFHADYVDPSWADNKVLVKQIGRHIFYY
jgi:spore germination cell wall hydrolase CwlJ-like protein